MEKKVRKGVFETNSSSTHSICIAKNITIDKYPQHIHFNFGEFGWEIATLNTIEEKASYLYTALVENNLMEVFEDICETLQSEGVVVTFEKPIYKTDTYELENGETKTYTICTNGGYIDHSNELSSFLADISTKEKLMSFLFSPLSFILTGNDNDDCDVEIDVIYDHYKYYKGN